MLELHQFLNTDELLIFLMVSMIAVVIQSFYFAELPRWSVRKVFEGLLLAHLIILSVLIRSDQSARMLTYFKLLSVEGVQWGIALSVFLIMYYGVVYLKGVDFVTGFVPVVLSMPLMRELSPRIYSGLLFCSIVLLAFRSAVYHAEFLKMRNSQITENSIKEALDVQHSGILFALEDGTGLLVNQRMLHLMEQTMGKLRRNANYFWDFLLELSSSADSEECIVQTSDQKIWQFQRSRLLVDGKSAFQVIASDVTEREDLNRMLQTYRRQLEAHREELQEALKNVECIRKEEAIRNTWNHVHDIIGQHLSILQRMLRTEMSPDPEKLFSILDTLQKDLLGCEEESPVQQFDHIVSIYEPIGVRILKIGELPQDEEMAQLFLEVIKEAVSNAVHHGRAHTITITMNQSPVCTMSVTNDGIVSAESIRSGEGLRGMDRKVRLHGGRLQIVTRPQFTLHVTFGASCPVRGRKTNVP